MIGSRTMLALVVVLSISGVATSVSASGSEQAKYHMTVPGSVDTPTRSVILDGRSYQVSEIAAVSPGTAIDVDVSAPSSTDYGVYLYTANRELAATKSGTGSERVTIETSNLDAGSYLLALYVDGTFEAIHPVVLSQYTLSIDAPETATRDETLELTMSVTGAGSPTAVTVVAVTEQTDTRVAARKTASGVYSASLSTSSFSEGAFSIYALAQGEQMSNGKRELLGISTPERIQITTEPVATTARDETGNTGAGNPTPDVPPEQTSTKTISKTTTGTETTRTKTTHVNSSVTTEQTTGEATDSNVITPNPSMEPTSASTTQTSGQAGFGFYTVLIMVVIGMAIGRRGKYLRQ